MSEIAEGLITEFGQSLILIHILSDIFVLLVMRSAEYQNLVSDFGTASSPI